MPAIQFNADLIDDLAHQRVVPFVGSGVSASAVTRGGQRIKTWKAFLESVSKLVASRDQKKQIANLIKEKDLLFAAELLKEALGDKWGDCLRGEFAQVATPSELHRAIVHLGQRIIVTTNFDKLLENAWNDTAIQDTHYPKLLSDLDTKAFRLLRDNQRYLIKLHGTIDNEQSLIFTKSEYTKGAYGSWAYSELMNNLLMNYTFLFIGFSMTDPAINLLIELYAHRFSEARPHYIFLPGPISQELQNLSKRLRRLYIIPYSSENNHKALPKHIHDLAEQARTRAHELNSQIPIVTKTTPRKKRVR